MLMADFKGLGRVLPSAATKVASSIERGIPLAASVVGSNTDQSQKGRVISRSWSPRLAFSAALNDRKPPFNDGRVRHAVAHELDLQLIVDRIMDGNATLIDGILSPDAFGKNPELPAYAYDPEKAKALLAEAGYPDGIDVTLDAEGALKDTAEAIASLLAKAGIRAKVVVGESSQLVARYRTKGEPIDGQMWLTSWGNGSLDPADIFVPTHRTADRGNSSGYANKELDALLDAANTELDQEKRAALSHQAEAIVNRDLPQVYLWVAKELYGVSDKVSGWQPSADSRINLHAACVN